MLMAKNSFEPKTEAARSAWSRACDVLNHDTSFARARVKGAQKGKPAGKQQSGNGKNVQWRDNQR